jgi:hypothetical protein
MNTASISFSCKEHLTLLLQELDTQADAVLASVFVIQNVRQKYEKATNAEEESECATVLREHGVALETDLSIIKLNAEFLSDEILETWIDAATSANEKRRRKQQVQDLTTKMYSLEQTMADLEDDMLGDDDNLLDPSHSET